MARRELRKMELEREGREDEIDESEDEVGA